LLIGVFSVEVFWTHSQLL